MAIAITRTEHDAAGLRQAASCTQDADAARRMLALALVMEGRSRAEAARTCGMDRQTLRDWVHRFNQEGLAGLSDRKPAGAKPRLSPEHQAELAALVRSGPDLAEHGVVRWRRIDLSKVTGRQPLGIAATAGPTSSGRSARPAAPAQAWCCPMPTRKP